MPSQPLDEKAVFNIARSIGAPEARAAYLEQACGDDAALRDRVEALLRGLEKQESFLESPAAFANTVTPAPVTEQPGDTIGPYKLLQQIGEGGMGVVYMAEQTEPVERRVALKIIKPGMDSRQVISRFEAERQALAIMDHPNIARVLDAGTTDSPLAPRGGEGPGVRGAVTGCGRPYFVMELVNGVPVTQYCDEQHLTPRERLKLFVPICQAVQHAHQKGIIHRDLKPSNILVARYDDKPVPKVIDFGVAKAVSQRLTEKTMFTQYGQIVGTIEYMSPEQAQFNQLDVDTRSDIYSLGVILYELLTGETPFDKQRLRSATFDEMLRIIREDEPPKPSTRLNNSETLQAVAANRRTEPKKLSTLVRGELDWIVMKALEKDRGRRYETASAFAADVQRHLNDEPVQACPPSTSYRLRKFVRRHGTALATASVLSVSVIVAVGAIAGSIGWMARENSARRAGITARVEVVLDEVDRLMRDEDWAGALAAAQRADTLIKGGEAGAATPVRVHRVLAELDLVQRLEEIRLAKGTWTDNDFNFTATSQAYAAAFAGFGIDLDSRSPQQNAAILGSHETIAGPLTVALDEWVDSQRNVPGTDESSWKPLVLIARLLDPDPQRNQFRSIWGQSVTPENRRVVAELARSENLENQPPATLVLLARDLHRAGLQDETVSVLHRAQERYPADFWINFELGNTLYDDRPEDAIRFYSVALGLRPDNTAVWNNLGEVLRKTDRIDEAIGCYRKAIELNPRHLLAHFNLAKLLSQAGQLDEAIEEFRTATEIDPKLAAAHFRLGRIYRKRHLRQEAIDSCRQAVALEPHSGPAHNEFGNALMDMGLVEEAIASYLQAISFEPENSLYYDNLGNALRVKGQFSEAIDCLRRAIELDSEDAVAQNNLGIVYRNLDRLEDAIESFRRATEIDPGFAAAHNNLGSALQAQGRLDEAIESFQRAIELDPENAILYYNLGVAFKDNDQLDEAIKEYRRSIELDPNYAPAHNNLGAALQAKGLLKEAVAAFENALQIDSQYAAARENLVRTSRQFGWDRYRAQEFRTSLEALETSCRWHDGGNCSQWIVMALAHWKLAAEADLSEPDRAMHRAEAQQLYERSSAQIDQWGHERPTDGIRGTVWDFRAEFRELMGSPVDAAIPESESRE